ncbi:MAG: DUF169 domain-containing protein [Bryobacteraceae bacterium]
MKSVQQSLGLASPPVAIAFLPGVPAGLDRWSGGVVPAGCAFWRAAMQGRTFFTLPEDHYNCAVGSHTHAIPLPADRAGELEQTVGFMVANQYLEMKEVPGIPVLAASPAAIAYGPVEQTAFAPDVVVVAATPGQAMILYEAALRAGAGNALTNTLGRPGCAALPLTAQGGSAVLSFGCKGNRTFVGLPDSEMYFVVPGKAWPAVAEQVGVIGEANAAMSDYYSEKASLFKVI